MNRLKQLRELKGMTQQELADLVGVTKGAVIQWMKVTEEVGEIRDVFLKPNDFVNPEWSLKDAIGDSIVTLVVLCLQLGSDVEECLTIAYNDIKDRQGVMIDDNFIKTKTRQPANDSNDLRTFKVACKRESEKTW